MNIFVLCEFVDSHSLNQLEVHTAQPLGRQITGGRDYDPTRNHSNPGRLRQTVLIHHSLLHLSVAASNP